MKEQVWSVSEVNSFVRQALEGSFTPFWISGEIGNCLIHRSGHVYMTLKDARSQIKACWFGGAAAARQLNLANGSLVEAYGSISVYEPRGEYQINIRQLRPAGVGMLAQKFEELKRKLQAEGLFDAERKRPIPVLPRRIGVVTSPTGAAIRDFLQIIDRRFPNAHILIYPCQVQGTTAAAEVARGVEFFNRTHSADVLVVTRGGGSMEDLWPFNEEIVARAVAASTIPVISAVGHEIDYTICDFVADLRVPTPSAAAELVIGHRAELADKLVNIERALRYAVDTRLSNLRYRLDRAAGSYVFREPMRLVEQRLQQIDELELRSSRPLSLMIERASGMLGRAEAALHALNPKRTLERGYAFVTDADSGAVITCARQPANKALTLHFADGTLPVETREP